MAIVAKNESGNIQLHPTGMFQAVCAGVEDLGMKETPWGEKHKISITWQTTALRDDSTPFFLSKWYTLSLHEQSNLYADLTSWRSAGFTADEIKRGFDVETMEGKQCQLNVVHKESADGSKTYANIMHVLPASPGQDVEKDEECYAALLDRRNTNQGGGDTEF